MTATEPRPHEPASRGWFRAPWWGRREGGVGVGVRTVALTSCVDHVEHQVTVEALELAHLDPEATVTARCGARIHPAPLAATPGRPCRGCREPRTGPDS